MTTNNTENPAEFHFHQTFTPSNKGDESLPKVRGKLKPYRKQTFVRDYLCVCGKSDLVEVFSEVLPSMTVDTGKPLCLACGREPRIIRQRILDISYVDYTAMMQFD